MDAPNQRIGFRLRQMGSQVGAGFSLPAPTLSVLAVDPRWKGYFHSINNMDTTSGGKYIMISADPIVVDPENFCWYFVDFNRIEEPVLVDILIDKELITPIEDDGIPAMALSRDWVFGGTFVYPVGYRPLLLERFRSYMRICTDKSWVDEWELPGPVDVSSDDTCQICLEEFTKGSLDFQKLFCHHGFHSECIHEWLLVNKSCPICRGVVLKRE